MQPRECTTFAPLSDTPGNRNREHVHVPNPNANNRIRNRNGLFTHTLRVAALRW